MRVLLDTNVLVSAIFFGGRPRDILDAWVEGRFELIVSPAVYDEYERVCERLAQKNPSLSYQPILTMLLGAAALVAGSQGTPSITTDPDDDRPLGNQVTMAPGLPLPRVHGCQCGRSPSFQPPRAPAIAS